MYFLEAWILRAVLLPRRSRHRNVRLTQLGGAATLFVRTKKFDGAGHTVSRVLSEDRHFAEELAGSDSKSYSVTVYTRKPHNHVSLHWL
eukprot:2056287-Amphidinium_carterae.1